MPNQAHLFLSLLNLILHQKTLLRSYDHAAQEYCDKQIRETFDFTRSKVVYLAYGFISIHIASCFLNL